MAAELRWNYSLNSGLLFGSAQPPATFAIPFNRRGVALPTAVDSVVPFRGTSYMNRQGGETARNAYFSYVRKMIALIDVPPPSGSDDDGAMRMVGVVTSLNDPHSLDAVSRNAPWEFYHITDPSDDDQLVPIIEALSATRPDITAGLDERGGYVPGRTSLFCGKVTHFSGMFPGAVVGVVGTPCRRDMEGRLTSVLVSELIQPRRLLPKWLNAPKGLDAQRTPAAQRQAARIMYLSGPFPRRALLDILTSAIENAVQRQATLLIIGGPILVTFDESDDGVVMSLSKTFADQLEDVVTALETHLSTIAATNPQAKALKIVMVPSLDDVTQIPVLPQLQYGIDIDDASPIMMGTNPCRIVHHGITIGVLQHDVVSEMRERMIERMQGREEGSLQRVVETILASRLYTPMFEVPSRIVDAQHLSALSIVGPSGKSVALVNSEEDTRSDNQSPMKHTTGYDDVPHLIFLPSAKPQFAFAARTANGEDTSSGPMVVNPMVWNHRNKRQTHFLNMVEVTIPDPVLASRLGLAHKDIDAAVSVFSAYRQ